MFFAVLFVSASVLAFDAEAGEAPRCPRVDNGNQHVHLPDTDCSKYWRCISGKAYLIECPDGLHFNKNSNNCDRPERALCSTDGSSEELNSDEEVFYIRQHESEEQYELCPDFIPNDCPAVDDEDSVYIPHPNCSQFCQCSNGLLYLHECSDGLHFNPVLNVCDWPDDAVCVSGNGTGSTATTTSTSSAATTTPTTITTPGTGTGTLCLGVVTNTCPFPDGPDSVYIPHPNCSQFCQCSNSLPYLHNCPDDLHFNPVLNVCDWPQDAGCDGRNGTDRISTTTESSGDQDQDATTESNSETTENTGTNELCPDEVVHECPVIDGKYPVYIPLPNCSQFCQCSNGLPYLHNCPDDLHFNPVLNVCDWPEDAGCAGGNVASTTTENDGEQESETTTTENNGDQDHDATTESSVSTTENTGTNELCPDEVIHECPAVDGKYPVYIPLPNCSQFCQCSNGLPYLHNCPDDLHFNPVLNVCDWPEDAGCAGRNETDLISTTTENNGGQESGTTITENSGGQGEDITTESSASTTENTGTNELCPEEVVHECPAVDGKYPVYIPLPNCSQFCQCSNGLPYLHNCPDDLHFNPVLNVCDWPEDAGCAGGNVASTTTENNGGKENETTTTENNGDQDQDATTPGSGASTTENTGTNELCPDEIINECPAIDGKYPVYIPLPNCSQFCQCSNGLPYLHNCPDDLHFNPVLNVCDWPEDAGCAGGNVASTTTENNGGEESETTTTESNGDQEQDVTTESTASTTENTGTNELCPDDVVHECPAIDGKYPVYIPLPNCSQFCQCSNGLPYLHNCPDDLHFNPVLNVCDWPEDAGCAGGNVASTTTENDGGQESETTTTENNGDQDQDATTESSVSTTENTGTNELCPEEVVHECPAVDGKYPVYIPLPNCSQFCQCSNGLPYLHNCPDDLHFNPVLNVCDWPEDAGCAGGNVASTTTENDGGQESETTTTENNGDQDQDATTESSVSTTENTGTNELCPEEVVHECPAIDGKYPVYIPLPNCSQFCQCSNGLPYLHNCPDDLHFNPVLNVCDWPEDAGCAGGNVASTTTENNGGEESETTTTESNGDQEQDVTTESTASTTENTGTNELCPDDVVHECPAIDGKYPVYIPLPNCSQFCQCSNGLPYLHNCPDDLHFNPVLNVCDWPEDAGCAGGNVASTTTENDGGQESETTTTENNGDQDQDATTESSVSTTENTGTNELCPEEVVHECPAIDGKYPVYIPLPNCSQFCQCSNGLPYLHNCPDDLHFNPVLNVCDWPEDAGCAGGNVASTTTENDGGQESETTTTENNGDQDQDATTESSVSTTENTGTNELCPEEVVHECPAVDGKYPVYIPLPNCSQFCQCSNGLPYLHNCPDDLHFNPVLNVCDWPEDAGCAGGNVASTTTENDGGQESETTTTENNGDQDQDATTESSVSTTENTGTNELCPEEVVHECPAIDGKYPVYIPLPNCSQFCQCSNGLPYLHNCPDDLHFNPVLNVCDWPEDAGCAGGNVASTTTENDGGQESETTTTENNGDQDQDATTESSVSTTENTGTNELCPEEVVHECPAVDGKYPVYIPLPNCSQFCQCSNGLPYLHNCPDDLHFNPILNVCDWPEDAGCAEGNGTDIISTTTESSLGQESDTTTTGNNGGQDPDATTTESSASTTENTGTNELCPDEVVHECPAVDGKYPVYIPLPNCSQFCQCSNGLPYLHNCPDDLHFNPILNVCDWPEDAGCAGGNGISTTTENNGDQESETTTTGSDGDQEQDGTTPGIGASTTENTGTNELCPEEVAHECPAIDGKYPVYIPLPNCSQFCQCSNGLPYLHNCPDDLHFNPILNVCDWPEDAGCGGGNGASTTTENNDGQESETTTTESSGGQEQDATTESNVSTENTGTNKLCPEEVVHECPAVDGKYPVYIPLPNCSQFCQCSNGLPYLHNCPDDLHFNPVLNVCDWPEDAGCPGGNGPPIITTTTERQITTTESSGSQEKDITTESAGTNKLCPDEVINECPAVDGRDPVYIPLPNCSQFCQCSNGLPYLHNCPDDLHFNPVLNVCDTPQNAQCNSIPS